MSSSYRVFRGGSWYINGRYCRSADRYRYTPDNRYHTLGFRVALVFGYGSQGLPNMNMTELIHNRDVASDPYAWIALRDWYEENGLEYKHPTRTIPITDTVDITLSLIPPGKFLMGSPEDEEGRRDDEGPQHTVVIKEAFYIGVHQVTQEQWEAVMSNNPSHFRGPKLPVERVSWNDCQEFCKKLSAKTGKKFGLPSEAQWEYACRAGTTTRYYSGDNESDLSRVGWYIGNSGSTTHPVGEKEPNAWMLYDIHGNVWEWCQDQYKPYVADSGESGASEGVNPTALEAVAGSASASTAGRQIATGSRRATGGATSDSVLSEASEGANPTTINEVVAIVQLDTTSVPQGEGVTTETSPIVTTLDFVSEDSEERNPTLYEVDAISHSLVQGTSTDQQHASVATTQVPDQLSDSVSLSSESLEASEEENPMYYEGEDTPITPHILVPPTDGDGLDNSRLVASASELAEDENGSDPTGLYDQLHEAVVTGVQQVTPDQPLEPHQPTLETIGEDSESSLESEEVNNTNPFLDSELLEEGDYGELACNPPQFEVTPTKIAQSSGEDSELPLEEGEYSADPTEELYEVDHCMTSSVMNVAAPDGTSTGDSTTLMSDYESRRYGSITRGGNWFINDDWCQSKARYGCLSGLRLDFVGLRIITY